MLHLGLQRASVKDMCFVIVTHVRKLEETVESVYGITDGGSYLEKFYDIAVRLPLSGENPSHEKLEIYLEYLLKTMDFPMSKASIRSSIFGTLLPICHMYNVELRSLEKIVTNLALFFLTGTTVSATTIPAISTVSAIRVLDSKLYEKFRNGDIDYLDMQEFMEFASWPRKLKHGGERLSEYWKALLGSIGTTEARDRFYEVFSFEIEPEERRRFLRDIVGRIDSLG